MSYLVFSILLSFLLILDFVYALFIVDLCLSDVPFIIQNFIFEPVGGFVPSTKFGIEEL